jgi:hypothetical protein
MDPGLLHVIDAPLAYVLGHSASGLLGCGRSRRYRESDMDLPDRLAFVRRRAGTN